MKYHKENQTVETERLLLRLFKENDAPDIARLCNNICLYKNTLYLPYPYAIEDALSWMKNHARSFADDRNYELAITDKDTGRLYGAIGLSNQQIHQNGELGYWIGEEYWGNGYATEAAKAMLEFAFIEKGYHKVCARYFVTNPASGKVIEKIGMQKEGILREHVKKDNEYIDLVCCGILKQEAGF